MGLSKITIALFVVIAAVAVVHGDYARQKVTICEGGHGRIGCPGRYVISIIAANYGRTEGRDVCPYGGISTTSCEAPSTLQKLRDDCNTEHNCTVYASNSVYGDPCHGTYKYLYISFSCVG